MAQPETQNPFPPSSDLIPTCGEVFPDGTLLELVRPIDSARPTLLLWNDRDQVIGDVIRHRGQSYVPQPIPKTILRRLNLPSHVGPFVTTRELLAEICKLADRFVGLPEKFTALIGRFILATWLVEAMPKAPRILIDGPDFTRARQLLQLMQCICRRGLRLGALGTGEFVSLPSGMRFTLPLGETSISAKLANLLEGAIVRANPRPQTLSRSRGAAVYWQSAGNGTKSMPQRRGVSSSFFAK